VTDKRFPGNPSESYRTRRPLRMVGELDDWAAHAPEVLRSSARLDPRGAGSSRVRPRLYPAGDGSTR